jgi:hypothetical protein
MPPCSRDAFLDGQKNLDFMFSPPMTGELPIVFLIPAYQPTDPCGLLAELRDKPVPYRCRR